MTLLERTQVLLSQRISNAQSQAQILREIAAASGGTVKFDWLKKFVAGEIDNPGVVTIQSLHDCLTKSSASATN